MVRCTACHCPHQHLPLRASDRNLWISHDKRWHLGDAGYSCHLHPGRLPGVAVRPAGGSHRLNEGWRHRTTSWCQLICNKTNHRYLQLFLQNKIVCYVMHRGLFITRSRSGNLLNRYAISQGLFIFWNERNGCKTYVTHLGLFIIRSRTGNLFNRHAISQVLFMF